MRKNILRAVIYARYSSDNQREESIEGQVNACMELAEKDGVIIVKVYADRAMTGRNDNRPQFQQMLKDAQNGLFDVLYLWKIDRFGRNRYEIILNKQKLKNAKIKIRYVKENIPDSPEGIILESMLEGMAEYYSANLAENVCRGLETNAEKCYYNGGNIPFGYKVVNKHFVLDEINAPIVQKIFVDYIEGRRVIDIADWLNENGYKNYGRHNVLRIIKNKRYTGRYIYTIGDKEICIENGLPRIVSDELFEQAQKRVEERRTAPATGTKKAVHSFSGKIKCGYCGGSVAITSTRKLNKIDHYYYYFCKNKNCTENKRTRREKIENVIFEYLNKSILTEENILAIANKVEKLQSENTPLDNTKQQIKKIDSKIQNIMTAIENGNYSNALSQRLEELEKEKSDLEIKIATTPKRKIIKKKEVVNFLSKYANGNIYDEEFQRRLTRTFIHEIKMTRNAVDVKFKVNDFIFEKHLGF